MPNAGPRPRALSCAVAACFHTGMRGMFPLVREAVTRLIDPGSLRWISWSHFEVDECGALNQWLAVAPQATPICGELGAMINVAGFSNRPARGLKPDEILEADDVPVSAPEGEVLWAMPAAVVRQLPSMRLQLTLACAGVARAVLGRYVLDHSASPPLP